MVLRQGLNVPTALATTVANEACVVVYRQEDNLDPALRPNFGVDLGTTIHLDRLEPGTYRLAVKAKSLENGRSRPGELPFLVSAR